MLSIAGSAQLRFLLPRVLPDGRIQLVVETEAAWHLLHPLVQLLPHMVWCPLHQTGTLPRGSIQVGKAFIRRISDIMCLYRFQVVIPDNYPDGDVPKVVLENAVFHPSVDPNTHVLNVKQVGLGGPINI